MNLEIERAGALVTAGLAASEIEGDSAKLGLILVLSMR
jgi:hypothetical protein